MSESALSREQLRSCRKRVVRAVTLSGRSTMRLVETLRRENDAEYPKNVRLPVTRGECVDGPRPCPFVSCRHHLYLDATDIGGLKLNFPDLEVWELEESCALDVADRGGSTLEEVADTMNITRERVRQVEAKVLRLIGPELEAAQ